MPYCEVGSYADGDKWEGVRLFYRRYGRGATKVLLIIGTHARRSPPDLDREEEEEESCSFFLFSHVVAVMKITFWVPCCAFR